MATIVIPKGTTDLTATLAGVMAGDVVVFAEGQQVVTGGLTVAVDLAAIYVDEKFSGVVGGGSSGSFSSDVDSGAGAIIVNRSPGSFYYTAGGVSTACTRMKQLGTGNTYVTGGTTTRAEVGNGRLAFNGSAVLTNLDVNGGAFSALYAATAITLADIHGGNASIQRTVTTLNVSNGAEVMVWREQTTSGAMPTGTTVTVTGGVLRWYGGNITTLVVRGGGRVDMSSAPFDLTITTLKGDKKALDASNFRSSFSTVTLPTGANLEVRCGKTDTIAF